MKRILVIDDDARVRSVIVDTLAAEGYAVEAAENGDVGQRMFRSAPFDLIVTDLFMPEKEGIETIIELRRDFPAVKILALSGGATSQLRMAQILGANRWLRKPFDIKDLISSVANLFRE
jgi:DNA-binding response OmpR family regulator